MDLLLVDTKPDLCEAWRTSFADVNNVQVHNGKFESLIGAFDCLVSPANSFGLMDGGIDEAIIAYFGVALESRVQQDIWRCYRGEQPVGTCLMVPTENAECAWLAHCPTMRVPMDVSWTNNAYAAYLAALISAETRGIKTLACSGLGTLTGRMPPDVCARQMRFAYDTWRGTFTAPDWTKPGEREWRSYGRSQVEFLKHRLKRFED
jgi:O-acetyl-ADP-ribose deacetylase (regulator of RNase III)